MRTISFSNNTSKEMFLVVRNMRADGSDHPTGLKFRLYWYDGENGMVGAEGECSAKFHRTVGDAAWYGHRHYQEHPVLMLHDGSTRKIAS